MAHIYLAGADQKNFEAEIDKFQLACMIVDSTEYFYEYKVFGSREAIEKFLRESYFSNEDEDFIKETISMWIEGE